MKNFVSPLIEATEAALKGYLDALEVQTDPVLPDAMRYALFGSGKRVRPVLMLLAAEAVGLPHERMMPLACALECIHNYSLIHDDLPCMDDDDTRRGRPTVHNVYGEAMAVLAGDALLNLGHEILLEACTRDTELISAALAISQASGARGMAGGQAAEFSHKNPDKEDLKHIYEMKTGALIRAAITAPFIAASSPCMKDAERLAQSAGFVFQLADDLIDFRAGQDKDKVTFPSLCGEEETVREIERQRKICASVFDKLSAELGQSRVEGLREYIDALSHRLS